MERVTNIAIEALRRYFDSLFKFGYKNYADVERLIILTFLEEMLSYNYFGYVTEEDYNSIIKSMYCLAGDTCIIDFPSYATYDSIIRDYVNKIIPRESEDGNLRISEDCEIREKV